MISNPTVFVIIVGIASTIFFSALAYLRGLEVGELTTRKECNLSWKREAVGRGFAEWSVDEFGKVDWCWKDVGKLNPPPDLTYRT